MMMALACKYITDDGSTFKPPSPASLLRYLYELCWNIVSIIIIIVVPVTYLLTYVCLMIIIRLEESFRFRSANQHWSCCLIIMIIKKKMCLHIQLILFLKWLRMSVFSLSTLFLFTFNNCFQVFSLLLIIICFLTSHCSLLNCEYFMLPLDLFLQLTMPGEYRARLIKLVSIHLTSYILLSR